MLRLFVTGKFLCMMVRIRFSDRVRVSGRVRVMFRVSVRTSKVSIKCHRVANVVTIYTAAV